MPVYNIAFWICSFFLVGVLIISVFNNILMVALAAFLISACLIVYKKYNFALLFLFVIVGALYSQEFNKIQNSANVPFGTNEFSGIITKIQQSDTSQSIVLNLQLPYSGNVKINTKPYPSFVYGDLVKVKGNIQKPPPESANYYAKEGVLGIASFPQIELIKSGQGSPIKSVLLSFRNKIIGIFKQILPSEKAAFMAGLTIGAREDFSKDLTENMKQSGTTHLVALSGYNISIIAIAVMSILGGFLSRQLAFYFATAIIVLFVLMTGAEASVVRAAIMGIIALLATQAQRIYSLRNAIVIAAFLMVLFNPNVLVFDVGFQLSFLALLGIVYLAPAIKKLLNINTEEIFNWKENLAQTLSAQLFVLPLLISTFGFFSLSSIFANVLILGVVPYAMGLGFIMAGLGFISIFLAKIIGLIENVILAYMLFIIDLFSRLSL
ncbi:MAG: ComEC/Rec2 family competence protein, partial [Candidatus Pacebacteria bacterium]|nr:ComEC/Rec2 family competence protein [Candidatus Paceibacterota bacterium]